MLHVEQSKHADRYLTAKELSAAAEKVGLTFSDDYARRIIRDCPLSVGRQIKFDDAIEFLRVNKDYQPRARRKCSINSL